MSRILKRPMFRKGGTPNEGIMSGLKETRPGYATGVGPGLEQIIAGEKLKMSGKPYYTEPYIQNKFDDYKSKFFAIPTEKIDMAELGGYGFIEAPQSAEEAGIMKFIQTQPEEAYKLFKKGKLGNTDYSKKQAEQIKAAEEAGLGIDFKLPPPIPDPENNNNNNNNSNKNSKENLIVPKSDTDTIKDYMDMFKTALAEDPDEIRRQKYLQLAQFGANLLAQPGGDLAAAVGKAAEPSLAGLAKIQERKQDVATKAKLLGVEAAMKKGQLAQNIQDLVDLGYSREEAIKKIVEEGSGSATRQATEQKAREQLTSYISETHGMPSATASRISGKVFASGIPDYLYDLIPSNPTQEDVGKYFYDKVGNVGKLVVKDGKFGLDDGKK
jgi:hypothetical protein